jgi:NADH:ubiquinone oxidoreductase subunit
MGVLGKIFTWWNGATVGTSLFTRLNGREVGRDEAGNVYYEHKKNPRRRWVIYSGDNDASRVGPGWQLWLRGTIDDLPEQSLPPARSFQKPPVHNLTGTMAAFRPDGALGSGKTRPASTGDYQPWTPD